MKIQEAGIDHNQLTILSFPQDNATWRLDWFGDVSYQRHVRYKNPLIRVALSKVTLDANDTWSYGPKFPDADSVAQAVVPVSLLPPLKIGTIWQVGTMIADPGYTEEAFDFVVSKETVDLVKSGMSDGDYGYILPFEAHPFHKAHTQSYCLHVSLEGGKVLIIPAMETIRFYFGSSSGLLSRLFKAPFKEDRLWVKADMDEKRAAEIELAEGLSGASAQDVARIAFSKPALHAAKTISSSLLTPSSHGGLVYPKSHFPFYGRTQLRARGVWLEGVEPKTFLAFQMLSCTHPFPFNSLKYTQQKRRRTNESDGAPGTEPQGNDTLHSSRRKDSKRPIVNDAPDPKRSAKPLRFISESRFPDLDYKSVARTDVLAPTRVVIADDEDNAAAMSVGDPEGQSSYRPVDVVPVNAAPVLKGHPLEGSAFAKAVEKVVKDLLAEGNDVWFVPLSAKQRYPQFSVMPEIILDGGEIHSLSYVGEGEKRRERYVTILRVKSRWPEKQKIWVLPEARDGFIRRPDRDQVVKESVDDGEIVNADWVGRVVVSLSYPAVVGAL